MLWTILVTIFIAYWVLGTILYFMQHSFTYHPVREVSYSPAELGLDFEKVILRTADGLKISGWYVPAENAKFTVLFCHGNGGNMTHRLDSINLINELGLNCLIFDYRGYGSSEGKPSELGTYHDAEAAYAWLRQEKRVGSENIILFGRSLGASVASYLAQNYEVRGLIIESGFTSYADIGQKFYPYMPVRLFARYSYKTEDYIKKIDCPILIIHSRNDEIIPFEFGLRLYDTAKEPKEFVEIFGSHNDGFLHSAEIYKKGWQQWLEFVKTYQPQKKPALRIS